MRKLIDISDDRINALKAVARDSGVTVKRFIEKMIEEAIPTDQQIHDAREPTDGWRTPVEATTYQPDEKLPLTKGNLPDRRMTRTERLKLLAGELNELLAPVPRLDASLPRHELKKQIEQAIPLIVLDDDEFTLESAGALHKFFHIAVKVQSGDDELPDDDPDPNNPDNLPVEKLTRKRSEHTADTIYQPEGDQGVGATGASQQKDKPVDIDEQVNNGMAGIKKSDRAVDDQPLPANTIPATSRVKLDRHLLAGRIEQGRADREQRIDGAGVSIPFSQPDRDDGGFFKREYPDE